MNGLIDTRQARGILTAAPIDQVLSWVMRCRPHQTGS